MIFKGLHILLAFNLLISTIGFRVFEHICSKNGTSIAIFIKSNSCCTKKKKKCCSAKKVYLCETKDVLAKGQTIKKKPCCEDKSHYKKLNTNASEITKVIFSDTQTVFYSPIVGVCFDLNDKVKENAKTLRFYLHKPPPLSVDNLRVLYQSFLC